MRTRKPMSGSVVSGHDPAALSFYFTGIAARNPILLRTIEIISIVFWFFCFYYYFSCIRSIFDDVRLTLPVDNTTQTLKLFTNIVRKNIRIIDYSRYPVISYICAIDQNETTVIFDGKRYL